MVEGAELRILQLLKTSVGATWALRQMRELVKLGIEVHVALPPGPLVPEYRAAGITVHSEQFDFPIRNPSVWPAMFKRLCDLVCQVEPSVIHSHFVGTTLTMRLALGKTHSIPRIFQVPGPLHLEHIFFRQAELMVAGSSDYWIGSCQWSCERYKQSGIPKDRVFLSYYGVDADHFKAGEKGKLRRELALRKDTRIVGMVAYMYPPKRFLGQTRGLKGHEDLIDALAICLKQKRDILGVFIGGAWNGAVGYEDRVRANAQKRLGDHAVFLGTRTDVSDLYTDLDVVVHPSHSENVGGAAESLLLAVPTIASNVGGLPDLVKDGQTGWLVPARSPHHLAKAILEALDNEDRAKEMASKGQLLAAELFDVRNTARRVKEIYQTVLSSHQDLVLRGARINRKTRLQYERYS
jgi:glycosyltransferase involved in cell wall biosynthesis